MIGKMLGPYHLLAELGSGGMGKVWRAVVTRPAAGLTEGTVVAVKIVHAHLLETEGFFKRFLREAELGMAVVHPNVVRTFDADAMSVDGAQKHFLVMEYVEGQTLRSLLGELDRVPEELCRHIGVEVAKALTAIHAAGAVHRDLKPENVLITREHVVKVMDLGVARLADEALRLSHDGSFVGSVEYAAPEQFRDGGRGTDARTDLHALGLVLYELATGRHPYRADDVRSALHRLLDETPRRLGEVNSQLSPFYEEVVHQLLAKKREDRFASAEELVRILEEGEKGEWWKVRAKSMRIASKGPLRRVRIPRETAVYGREKELAELRSMFLEARAGNGQVVVIEGEAGIGKSRLVDEFVASCQREGEDLNFLWGSYPPGGAATAAGAFSTAYREHFGGEALEATLPQYLVETPVLVPAFAALLRGETQPSSAEPLTKDSLQTVFVHATRALARERPTIVLIDDLHFAPAEGRALFASLALATAGHRILLVGTTRPGTDEGWFAQIARVGARRMALARLGPKDLVRLLEEAFHSKALAQELGARVAVKSDGNPFFVFEILRGLREGQFLTKRDDGTWATTAAIRELRIPSTVLDLVNARVGDLGDEERNLLDVACCCGFEFDPLLVAQAAGIPPVPAMQRLARIEKRHRLVRSAGRVLTFDHHQVQEALYGALLDPLREAYHAAIAGALESRSGAATADPMSLGGALCVDLAEHFLKGAQGRRALRYLDAALTHLERGYQNDQAIALSDLALAAPGLLTGRDRVPVLLRKAARLNLFGRREAERAALDEARSLADAAGEPAPRAHVRTALGLLLHRVSRNDEAQHALAEAIALARNAADRRIEARATSNLGLVLHDLGRNAEARELLERSLAIGREVGDRALESNATGNLANVLTAQGCYAEVREQYGRLLATSRACGDRLGEALAAGNLGGVLRTHGQLAEAQEHLERSLELCREIGDRLGEARVTGNLGLVFLDQCRYAEACEHLARNVEISREIEDRLGEARATGNLGLAYWNLGRYAEARERYERSLALNREIGYRMGEAVILLNLGELRLGLGDTGGARDVLQSALAICRSIGARGPEGAALAGLGGVADAAGDGAAAVRYAEEALALWKEIGYREGVRGRLLEVGDMRRRAGDVDGARDALAQAVALSREQGRLADVALGEALLACLPGGDVGPAVRALAEANGVGDSARVRYLLWHATHDRTHLVRAKRLLDDLVAHAPPECREPMVENVRLNREIAAAARAEGL